MQLLKKLIMLTASYWLISLWSYAYASDPMRSLTNWSQNIAKATNGRLNLSGYFNGHYMKHDGMPVLTNKNLNKPLKQLREASLFADVMVSDSLMFSTELELSYDFTDSEISGRDKRFEALFNYYYLDLDLTNATDSDEEEWGTFKIRAGRFLVPFLQYNENKPNFKQNLMSQPFTAWQLVPVNNIAVDYQQYGWTDVGLMANWSYSVEDTGIFDIKLSFINGLGTEQQVLDYNHVTLDPEGMMMQPNVRPRDGLANSKSEWNEWSDVNDDIATAVKISFALFDFPLNVGLSWYQGAWDADGNMDLTLTGIHMDYIEKNWTLKGEWVTADVEQTAGINVIPMPGPAMINSSTGNYDMAAWYVELSYTPLRYDQYKFVKIIARADSVDTNDQAMFTPFDRSRITLGLEWQFLPNIRLRYERQRHNINDFDKAPMPFIQAGGKEEITMNMISIIAHF